MNLPPLPVIADAVRYRVLRPFGDTNYTPFILLSRSRTGSNLLNSSLGGHPNVRVKGEHFGNLQGDTIEQRHAQVFGLQPKYIQAAGCKVFYYHPHHGDPAPLFELLKSDPRLKVIHLKRKDTLRSVLSWMIAQKNQTYVAHSQGSLVAAKDKAMRVDPDEMVGWIRRTLGWEEWGDAYFSDHDMLQVTYEAMTENLASEFGRVVEFLNLPPHQPVTSLRRQNPESLGQLVLNLDEVLAALDEAGLSHLAADGA